MIMIQGGENCTFACLEGILWAFTDMESICSLESGCDQASVGGISWRRWNRAERIKLVEVRLRDGIVSIQHSALSGSDSRGIEEIYPVVFCYGSQERV